MEAGKETGVGRRETSLSLRSSLSPSCSLPKLSPSAAPSRFSEMYDAISGTPASSEGNWEGKKDFMCGKGSFAHLEAQSLSIYCNF